MTPDSTDESRIERGMWERLTVEDEDGEEVDVFNGVPYSPLSGAGVGLVLLLTPLGLGGWLRRRWSG